MLRLSKWRCETQRIVVHELNHVSGECLEVDVVPWLVLVAGLLRMRRILHSYEVNDHGSGKMTVIQGGVLQPHLVLLRIRKNHGKAATSHDLLIDHGKSDLVENELLERVPVIVHTLLGHEQLDERSLLLEVVLQTLAVGEAHGGVVHQTHPGFDCVGIPLPLVNGLP